MWHDSKHHGSSLGRLQWTDSRLAETRLDSEPSLHVFCVESLGSWRPLIFPSGVVTSPSLLLSPVVSPGLYLWATLLPGPQCPPLLTLLVFPWGVGISLSTSATQISMAGPVPRYSRNFYLNIRLSPHPHKNLSCLCLLTCFSPWRFPRFWEWHCDSSLCPGLKLKPCLKQYNEAPKMANWEALGAQFESLLCYSKAVDTPQISKPISSTTKWEK